MDSNIGKLQAECWFLDVGQGTANVILLGDGRAIVIDCGPKSCAVPLRLLKRHISTIEVLLISHNDIDHDGGAARIIQSYAKAIKSIYFLADRPAHQIATHRLCMSDWAKENLVCKPKRLEAAEKPRTIFSDPSKNLSLKVFYPTFSENLDAERSKSNGANRTSAILALFSGPKSIVFSGDATAEAWEAVSSRLRGHLPLRCDVMTVPHHGGHLSQAAGEQEEAMLCDRLYGKIVRPRFGIISVASSNQFGKTTLPLRVSVACLRKHGVNVLCTQITPKCCDDLEALRPGLVEPMVPSRSTGLVRTTRGGKSKDVACAGTILAEISESGISIPRWPEHQKALRAMTADGIVRPLCRNGASTS